MASAITLAFSSEPHTTKIVKEILSTKQAIETAMVSAGTTTKPIFLSIWDFDGTILHGDCSEGLKENEKVLYKGLAQIAIETGLSSIYTADSGFTKFWHDYRFMEENISRWLAYPFIPQMLRGADASAVRAVSRNHFREQLQPYYFTSSVAMIAELERHGIETHIISASSDLFVDESAPTLNLPVSRFNGIELQVEQGKVTEKIVYPVTWADGKTEKLKLIVDDLQRTNPNRPVIVLAGFGNSWSTDGSFLHYIANQNLPAGKPLSVMINGGKAPEKFVNTCLEVNQKEMVGR